LLFERSARIFEENPSLTGEFLAEYIPRMEDACDPRNQANAGHRRQSQFPSVPWPGILGVKSLREQIRLVYPMSAKSHLDDFAKVRLRNYRRLPGSKHNGRGAFQIFVLFFAFFQLCEYERWQSFTDFLLRDENRLRMECRRCSPAAFSRWTRDNRIDPAMWISKP
jgi:hypothetical protein